MLDGKEDCADASDENYCEVHDGVCNDAARCSFQRDVQAFGCGCPKGFMRAPTGICELVEERLKH